MTNIAIRVDHPCPEPGRRMSKLYRIAARQQRPDTPSTALRAGFGAKSLEQQRVVR